MNIYSEVNNHNIKTAFWRAAKVQLNGCEQPSLADHICLGLFNFLCMLQACFRILKRKIRLLIWDVSSFIMYTFSYKLSSQYRCNRVPWILTFYIFSYSFSFLWINSVCFKSSLKTSSLIHALLKACCIQYYKAVIFQLEINFKRSILYIFSSIWKIFSYLCILTSSLNPFCLMNMLWMIFWIILISLNLLRLVPHSGYDFCVPWGSDKNVYSVAVEWNVL